MVDNIYDDFVWKIGIELELELEDRSVSIKYEFLNQSKYNNFYYHLLPRFQLIPKSVKDKLVEIEGVLFGPNVCTRHLFSYRKELEGISDGNDCLLPFDWSPSDGYIPPESSLQLNLHWIEKWSPNVRSKNGSYQQWRIEHCLPMSKLFLPLKFRGSSDDVYTVFPPEHIKWTILFPKGVTIQKRSDFLVKPNYEIEPNIEQIPGEQSSIKFQVHPNSPKIRGECFRDHEFNISVDLTLPKDIQKEICQRAEKRLREYTYEVCVAIVDLRGSSAKAEEQRDLPDPSEYISKFQQLAQEVFPCSLYQEEPLKLLMKKVPGDMVILIVPVERTVELAEAVLKFLERLSTEGFKYRAGFHVDQATDTGKSINSQDDFGVDFFGPAVNYATKVGDDKGNEGIRVTESASVRLRPRLEKRYDFIKLSEKSFDLNIFELKSKEIVSSVAVLRPVHFADRLLKRILSLDSKVCVGLDPDLSRFPQKLLKKYGFETDPKAGLDRSLFHRAANCIVEFNKMVVDAIRDCAVAVKPQSAHYERFGHFGIQALHETALYARASGMIVILDAKRNDIGSTAKKYACAYLGPDRGPDLAAIPFDAITVNPYLGIDGIRPFMDICSEYGKGIFVLVKTSNPSSTDLQDLPLHENKTTLSQRVASLVNQWGSDSLGEYNYSSVGAVVGATHPEDVRALRKRMPQSIFLMPGYGVQGGKADDVKDAFDKNGFGALITSSRGIIYPCSPETDDFQHKIEEQVHIMRKDLEQVICQSNENTN